MVGADHLGEMTDAVATPAGITTAAITAHTTNQ